MMTNTDRHMVKRANFVGGSKLSSVDRLVRLYSQIRGGHFFDTQTLEYFGESLRTMAVQPELVECTGYNGSVVTCYVLETLQHIPMRDGTTKPQICRVFFDVQTLDDIDREYEEDITAFMQKVAA